MMIIKRIPIFHPAEPPGSPACKENAFVGGKIGEFVIISMVLYIYVSIIIELMDEPLGRIHRRIDERYCMWKRNYET
jgi:hypothetical protein